MIRRAALSLAVLFLVLTTTALTRSDSAVVNGPSHDGVEVTVDLPLDQQVKNFGAPKDHLGLCVFATLDMCARWQHVQSLIGVIKRMESGGGWPEKVERVVKQYGENKVEIVQYQGSDPAFLDLAMKNRRAVGVTYGYGERYGMQQIAHMVMLVYLDADRAAILDNNFPGTIEWMSRAEFLKRWKYPSGSGWAYVLMDSPPTPAPCN